MKIAKTGMVLVAILVLIAGAACDTNYTLTTGSSAGGSVTAPGEPGPFTYAAGTSVNIVATPDTGYQFVNWTGHTAAIADPEAASTTITMNGDYSVSANFASADYTLTTGSSAGGSVSSPGEPGPFTYTPGTSVEIVAITNACYRFINWTGDTDAIADPEAASTTITMNGDYSVSANFDIEPEYQCIISNWNWSLLDQ